MNANRPTVTRDRWNVSFQTGTNIDGVILHVFKMREDLPSGRRVVFQNGDANGKRFATDAEAKQYALDHGYVMPFVTAQCPHCKVVHTFLGHRSGWCDVTGQFI